MCKKKNLRKQFAKIVALFIFISFLSCKTQQQVNSSQNSSNNAVNTNQSSGNSQQEEKPLMVTPDLLENQKINEFAKEKSKLLCSMNKLMRDYNNETDKGIKGEISEQINELKKEISILDSKIESDFQGEDGKEEVDKLARYMAKDC